MRLKHSLVGSLPPACDPSPCISSHRLNAAPRMATKLLPPHHTTTQPHTTAASASAAAAAGGVGAIGAGPAVTFRRLSEAQPAAVVAERRAADVAVLGDSTAAVLTAYTLAKAGKKVLFLPSFGLSATTPKPRRLQPLKLPDPDPLLVHLASESAPYWRGLEVLSGAPLLAIQAGSADVVLDPEMDHAGAIGFNRLQEACAAAGVPTSLLSGSEANAAFRLLQLPTSHGRSSCLLQQEGAVIRAAEAAGAARQLANNVGVMIRDGLMLQGWRDRGSCFELRAASRLSPDLISLYEAEVLLLAPGAWQAASLSLFGLQVAGLEAREVLRCQAPISNSELLLQAPLIQTWGAAVADDSPLQPEGITLLPSGIVGDGSITVQQQASWGMPMQQPWEWQPAAAAATRRLVQQVQQLQGQEGDWQEGRDAQKQPGPLSGARWAELQVSQLHASCSKLLRGAAPLYGPASLQDTQGLSTSLLRSCRSSVVSCTADGRPVLDSHPGFEPGRVMLCCAVAGSERFGPGSSNAAGGYQLSPILAKMTADAIRAGGYSTTSDATSSSTNVDRDNEDGRGSSTGSTSASSAGSSESGPGVLRGLGLQRPGMCAEVFLHDMDSWEGLGQLQEARALSAQQLEEQQALARDAAQDLMGTRQ